MHTRISHHMTVYP